MPASIRWLVPVALLVVLAPLLLAGCLGQDEPVDPAETGAQPEAGSAGSPPPEPNGTSGDDGTEEDDGAPANGTGSEPPEEEPGPRLPANLSMEGATALERTPTRVVFSWSGRFPAPLPGTDGNGSYERTRSFDVPAGVPLWVNASLQWDDASNLDLAVRTSDVVYCNSILGSGLTSSPEESCGLRTLARSSWDRWNLNVERYRPDSTRPQGGTSFNATLTLEVAPSWEAPPFNGTSATTTGATNRSWAPLAEADIRPGVKFEDGTANFIFSDPRDGDLYLGWISHGVYGDELGDKVPLNLHGGTVEGTLVYCSWGMIEETVTCPQLRFSDHPQVYNDFALVRLPDDARDRVHPATMFWGGPTELGTPPDAGSQVLLFGNTDNRDGDNAGVNPLDPQRGIVRTTSPRQTEIVPVTPGVPGDSGSPVLRGDGAAFGTVSSFHTFVSEETLERGTNGVANLPHAIAYMEDRTSLDVELETWELFPEPRHEDLARSP